VGEQLRHEFSMSPVDTGQMTPPVPIPGVNPTQIGGPPQNAPLSGDFGAPGSWSDPNRGNVPGLPPSSTMQIPGVPIHRPSFLQSFLANLGPSLAGGVLASGPNGEQNFGTALAGGLAGIQSYQEKQFQRAQQIQQAQRLAAQQASEQALQSEQTKRLQQVTPLEVQEQTMGLQAKRGILSLANDPAQIDQMLSPMSQSLGKITPDEQAILDSARSQTVANLKQGTFDVSPYNQAVAKIAQDRIGRESKEMGPREDARYEDIQAKLAQQLPVPKEDQAWAKGYEKRKTLGPVILAGAAGGRQQSTQNFDVQKDTFKRYDTALDADQRLSRMEASYGKAVNGDQQAMLALLSDHLGMTMGLQRGARITKDILNEAQQSQPWLAQLGAKFDSRGFLSGVTLGKDQMAQMLDLGYEARDRSWQSAQDATQLYGVAPPKGAQAIFSKRNVGEKPALTGALPNGNGRVIDKATAMQFYEAAGRDPQKAQQLATQNGWKVQ